MVRNFASETDEVLMMQIQQGSRPAFAELVTRHALTYQRLAFRFLNSRADAEDVVQDAFLKLWQNPHVWVAGRQAKFTTWFYRVVVNKCLDARRSSGRTTATDDFSALPDHAPMPDSEFEEKARREAVERGFTTLPMNMQTALNLSFYEGVANRDAAEIMGMSLKAFQSLLMRAKKALKDAIMNHNATAGVHHAK